jgi:hypothetical protein
VQVCLPVGLQIVEWLSVATGMAEGGLRCEAGSSLKMRSDKIGNISRTKDLYK